jgi:ribosome-binding factor A
MSRHHSARSGRSFHRRPGRPEAGRKALQLCKQVERTLVYVLSGETGDDILRDLVVENVIPAPNDAHLMAIVRPMTTSVDYDLPEVLERLHAQKGLIREEVAAAINRKHVPEISFQVIMGTPEMPRPMPES